MKSLPPLFLQPVSQNDLSLCIGACLKKKVVLSRTAYRPNPHHDLAFSGNMMDPTCSDVRHRSSGLHIFVTLPLQKEKKNSKAQTFPSTDINTDCVPSFFQNQQKSSFPFPNIIMKFSSVASVVALAASGAKAAANSEEVDFLTKLVSDYDDNKKQYLNFAKTATDMPKDLTKLALAVNTYKDDSYTTLLEDSDIDVSSLMNYASELPWYSRLEKGASASGSGSSGSSGSTSAGGAGSALVAPVGAALGAVALALM